METHRLAIPHERRHIRVTMVNYRRNPLQGGTYFFTVALADRRSARLTTHIDLLRQAFQKARAEHPFAIDAIVVLPDHLHTIFTLPEADADFSHRWRRIKSLFTKSLLQSGTFLPKRDGTGRILWQRRFWEHTIRDHTDYSNHVDYIHYNPTKHGYAQNPADRPHSSVHRFVRKGLLPSGWGSTEPQCGNYGEPATHPVNPA